MAAKRDIITWLARKFKGVDKRDTYIDGDFYTAIECKNLDVEDSGKLCLRKGTHCVYRTTDTGSDRYLFGHNYTYFDTTDGSTQQELIAYQGKDGGTPKLYRLLTGAMTLTYVGAEIIRLCTISRADAGFRFTVRAGSSSNPLLFDTTYNTYLTSTIETLRAALDANADLTCTFTPTPSPTTRNPVSTLTQTGLGGGDLTSPVDLNFLYAEEIAGATLLAPSPDFADEEFLPPGFHNVSNVCVFACGNYPYVYDGLRVYRLGFPQAVLTSVAETGSGTTFHTGEVYIYKLIYKRVDYRGNIIEGRDSDDTLSTATITVAAANTDITLTIANLQTAAYLPRGAKINGTQAAVTTITVDAGHTLATDDVIYLYDTATSAYVTRTLTGTGATTLTFTGAVSVTDNAFISNNIRIEIWRTNNAGVEFFLVDEIPNDALNSSQTYVDDVTDASLGATFTEQVRKHDLPPKTRYITEHQGVTIFAGDPDNPNTVSFALPDAFYAVPTASNSFDIKESSKGGVTGVISDTDNMLAVFKTNSYTNVVGDLDGLNFKAISNQVFGCTAHATLAKLDTTIIGLSNNGPFALKGGEYSLDIGAPVRPEFENEATATYPRVLKRANAINDTRTQRYILYAGFESSRATNDILTRNETLVYDYKRGQWREYDYPDQRQPSGGMFVYNDNLYFNCLENNDADLVKELRGDSYLDYADDVDAIACALETQYLDLGNPSGYFKILWLKFLRFINQNASIVTAFTLEWLYSDPLTDNPTSSIAFAASEEEKRVKWPARKSRRVKLRITNGESSQTRQEKFEIDGFQLEVANPYPKHISDAKDS